MQEGKKPYILGMINARGGSRGIPGKNIKPLAGKPLIGYTVESGLTVPEIDRLIVSTDCPKIAEVARAFGAEIPFMRPTELASDTSIQIDTIRYNISRLEQDSGQRIDIVVLLQPTSPLRRVADISGSIEKLIATNADTVITISESAKFNPMGLWRSGPNHDIVPYSKTPTGGYNRQQAETFFWRTGSIYVMRRHVIMDQHALYGAKVAGYMVDEEYSCFNLDSLFDWNLCEAWIEHRRLLKN